MFLTNARSYILEALFSVTPEVIAVHHARRLANLLGGEPSSHTVLDLFAGAGGNCIQFAVIGFNGKFSPFCLQTNLVVCSVIYPSLSASECEEVFLFK